MKRLKELLLSHPYLASTLSFDDGIANENILGITASSALCKPGYLFVAHKGALSTSKDGHDFIDDAIKRGARAVVVEHGYEKRSLLVPIIRARDSREALSYLCEAFYGFLTKDMRVIGITGTNGKTSTSFFLQSILKEAGFNAAAMGTLGVGDPKNLRPLSHTTLEAAELSLAFYELKKAGITDVVMEVSSHALALKRVEAINFAAVGFTNLSHDHLDFHHTMSAYRKAKERLFKEVAHAQTLKILPANHDLCPSINELPLVHLYDPKAGLPVSLPFAGDFHQENARLALNIAIALGIDERYIREGLKNCVPIPGRFETVYDKGPLVIIDFAHTPEALKGVLQALKPLALGAKVRVVFGCGGNRDQEKRPLMGEIASIFADHLIITDDNPRSEEPRKIRASVISGARKGAHIDEIASRREAIRAAITMAAPNDVVLIAGKGHEEYQIYESGPVPFSDHKEAKEAVEHLCKT